MILIYIYLIAFSLILVKTIRYALYNFPRSNICHRSMDGESL